MRTKDGREAHRRALPLQARVQAALDEAERRKALAEGGETELRAIQDAHPNIVFVDSFRQWWAENWLEVCAERSRRQQQILAETAKQPEPAADTPFLSSMAEWLGHITRFWSRGRRPRDATA